MQTPEQRRVSSQHYYLKHKAKIQHYQRQHYEKHQAAIQQRERERYHADKDAIRARRKARYHTNKAPYAAQNKAWREKNRERRKAYMAANYAQNRDVRLRRQKQYRLNHLIERMLYERRRYYANRDVLLAANKTYRQAHPEVMNEAGHRYRARQRHAPRIEKIDRERLIARDRDICHICGKKIRKGERSIDHLIPISKGGNHTEDNVALAHRRCNSRRGAGRLPAQLRLFG